MKKDLTLFLTFILSSCLLCSSAHANTSSQMVTGPMMFSVTSQDTMKMSIYMNGALALVDGQWFYGPISSSNYAKFGKFKISDINEQTVLLSTYFTASYINIYKSWIYYIYYDSKDKVNAVYKMRISGSDKQLIISPKNGYDVQYMFVYGDKIYYTENKEEENKPITGSFIRTDLNGKNKKIILNKPVYFPYIIGDKLFYQDDRDRVRLHIHDLNNGQDQVLIDDVVFSYCINSNYIVYRSIDTGVSFDKNGNMVSPVNAKNIIKRYNLKSGIIDTLINEACYGLALRNNVVYYCNDEDSGRLYSYDMTNDSIDILSQDKFVQILGVANNALLCKRYNNEDWEYWEDLYIINMDNYQKVSYVKQK